MKKRLAALIILILALELTACGGSDRSTSDGRAGQTGRQDQTEEGDLGELAEELGVTQEQLEEYMQAEVTHPEEHLILFADSCDLQYGQGTTLNLTFRMPAAWEQESISLYLDGELLTTLSSDMLAPTGQVTLRDAAYADFQAEITVPDRGSEESGFTKVLTAVKGDRESNELVLYRNVEFPAETVENAGRTLDEINAIALKAAEGERNSGRTQGGEPNAASEKILGEVYTYLESNPDIKEVQRNGSRIDFITKDGFSSFFEIEDSGLPLAGNGDAGSGTSSKEAAATDISELEKTFRHDPTFRNNLIDPDVMVLCPIHSADKDRTGSQHIASAKALADHLGGSSEVYKDDACLNWSIFRNMSRFGTVMLCTHGGTATRADGSTSVNWRFYNQKVPKETAKSKFDELTNAADLIWELEDQYDFSQYVENTFGTSWLYVFRADENSRQGSFGIRFISKDVGHFFTYDRYYEIDLYTDAIMHFCPDLQLPNTVVYLGSCFGIADDRFNTFLLDHGASCVIGYEGSIACPTEDKLCKLLFEEAVRQNKDTKTEASACSYTVHEAAQNAINWNRWNLVDTGFSVIGEVFDDEKVSRFMSIRECPGSFRYDGYGTVEGTVTDFDGNPIEGAEVAAYRYFLKNDAHYFLQYEMQATTDKDGHYQFKKLKWGEYLIHAEYEDAKANRRMEFTESTLEGQDLQLNFSHPYAVFLEKYEGDVEAASNRVAGEYGDRTEMHYFYITDLNGDEVEDLITFEIVNFRYEKIRLYTLDEQNTVVPFLFEDTSEVLFDNNHQANGAYAFYLCPEGHLHNNWGGGGGRNEQVYVVEGNTVRLYLSEEEIYTTQVTRAQKDGEDISLDEYRSLTQGCDMEEIPWVLNDEKGRKSIE